MQLLNKKYILTSLVLTIILFALGSITNYLGGMNSIISPSLQWISILCFGIFTVNHYFLKRTENTKNFVNTFMLTSGFRILLLLSIVFIHAFINAEGVVPFMISFVLNYVGMLGIEVFFMNKDNRRNKKI